MSDLNKLKQEDYILASQVISFCMLGVVILVAVSSFKNPVTFNDGYYNTIVLFLILLPTLIIVRILSIHNKNFYIDNIINILFLLLSALFLVKLPGSSFEILLLMPIIVMALKYGKKHAMVTAVFSFLALLYVSIKKDFSTIDSDIMFLSVFFLVSWLLGNMRETETDIQKRLERLANYDGLTDVFNHRKFQSIMDEELERADKGEEPLSLIMLDLDYFKLFNDSFGHQKGDQILKGVADILRRNIPPGAYCARYGGEEFAIILPGAHTDQAIKVGENIRRIIENTNFEGIEVLPKGRLTASFGVAEYPHMALTREKLIHKADQALYKAKYISKNKVEAYYSVFDELSLNLIGEERDIFNSISTLTMVINAKDRYTYGHSERTMELLKRLAERLGFASETVKELVYSALLHDIGKIEIPREILNKATKLSDDEWEVLRQHPVWGANIISPLNSLKSTVEIVRYHHENYDGSGYPSGLKGENIPLGARILRIVDSYDAMTSNRSYKEGMNKAQAIEELKIYSGRHFDPGLLQEFVKMMWEN